MDGKDSLAVFKSCNFPMNAFKKYVEQKYGDTRNKDQASRFFDV